MTGYPGTGLPDLERGKFQALGSPIDPSDVSVKALLYGQSGTGFYPVNVASGTGALQIAGTFSATTTENSVAAEGAKTPGSATNVGGQYLGSLYPLRMDLGSYALMAGSIVSMPAVSVTAGSVSYVPAGSVIVTNMVAGSIVYMPAVSATNPAVAKDNTTAPGSAELIAGKTTTGSILSFQAGPAGESIVLGSVNINNPASVGSLATQNMVGSVAVSSTPAWTGIGSIYGIGIGSVAAAVLNPAAVGSFTTQGVSVSAGSVQTYSPLGIGSVLLTNAVTMSTGSVWAIGGSVNVTNAVGSFAITNSINMAAGSVWAIGGSVNVTNAVGSVAITNTPSVNLAAGSAQLYATSGGAWYPLLAGSNTAGGYLRTQVENMVAGSIVYMPAVSVTTGSASYIPAGSVIVTNMVAGSIVYMPSVTTSASNVAKEASASPGSTALIAGNYLGSVVSLQVSAGSELLVAGSIRQNTNPWIVLGSAAITSLPAVTMSAGSVWAIGGSVNVTNAVGSVAITSLPAVNMAAGSVIVTAGSIQATIGAGSIQTYSPLGVGSIYGIGIGSVAVSVISPASIGSYAAAMLITGSAQVTVGAGSIQTYTPLGIGSVLITNGSQAAYNVENLKGTENFTNGLAGPGSPFLVLSMPSGVTSHDLLLVNAGSTDCYYNMGLSGAAFNVSTSGTIFPAGGERTYNGVVFSKFEFITAAGSTTVYAHMVGP